LDKLKKEEAEYYQELKDQAAKKKW
jgi:hypothetical protein